MAHKPGKQYQAASKQVQSKEYLLEEAVPLLKKIKFAKFDETVEVHMRLGVDPKHADQMVPGTVTVDIARAVKEVKAGKVEFRVDKTGIIHAPVGKVSFAAEKLVENASSLISAVIKAKPAVAKGKYVRSATICSTMGPGVSIDTTSFSTKAAV